MTRPTEQLLYFRDAAVLEIYPMGCPGYDEPAFKSIGPGGVDFFTFEEVHHEERHLIEYGQDFKIRHFYRLECGAKTRCQRVEFGLITFPIERPDDPTY